ncbi:MAG: CvpA family protein [Caulobacteraceae bacterium]
MNAFDAIAGLVVLVSGLVGFVRGATREVTTAVAFAAAALIAIFSLRFTGPIARQVIHTPWLARTAAVLILFVAAYLLFRTVGGALTQSVRQTALSGFDRTLGAGLGVVRGLVVIGGLLLLFEAATPPERMPPWMTGARVYPLAAGAAGALRALAPQGMRAAGVVGPAVVEAVEGDAPLTGEGVVGSPARTPSGEARRRALDVTVEKPL